WSPRAIGDHGAPVSLPKLKKAYEKGTRGISWGPLLTPGPRAVPEFPNGQSAPGCRSVLRTKGERSTTNAGKRLLLLLWFDCGLTMFAYRVYACLCLEAFL
ncbi:unnamed protein product, partial [Staurois parvus]